MYKLKPRHCKRRAQAMVKATFRGSSTPKLAKSTTKESGAVLRLTQTHDTLHDVIEDGTGARYPPDGIRVGWRRAAALAKLKMVQSSCALDLFLNASSNVGDRGSVAITQPGPSMATSGSRSACSSRRVVVGVGVLRRPRNVGERALCASRGGAKRARHCRCRSSCRRSRWSRRHEEFRSID